MFQEYVPRELWLRKACALPRNFPEYISWNTFLIVFFLEYISKSTFPERLYPCINKETGDGKVCVLPIICAHSICPKLIPRIYFPEYISQSIFPRVYFPEYISQNIFPQSIFPRIYFAEYILQNIFHRIYSPEYISQNIFPTVYFPRAYSHRDR